MNGTFKVILLLTSALCFVAASFNFPSRINLIAAGLLAWELTVLLPQFD